MIGHAERKGDARIAFVVNPAGEAFELRVAWATTFYVVGT
ncbi:hypothetical protein MTE01_28700 [Microbacterium testaceum]|uniref:Uncharacterized protein n=1 Tax=Microbacterium testaceum TaxID=2033 RepID=A0A4Y3QNT2_MICTE|nr:hypothetical protein MTE01_28700 [Microbacterium testaceum]